MYADEAKIWSRVQCGREDGVVGSLAARGVVEGDWSGVWQPAHGAGRATVLAKKEGSVEDLELSPDGEWLLARGADGPPLLLSTKGGAAEPLLWGSYQFLNGKDSVLLVVTNAGEVLTIDSDLMTRFHRKIEADSRSVRVISPEGSWILTQPWDGDSRLWSTRPEAEPLTLLRERRGQVAAGASPDGQVAGYRRQRRPNLGVQDGARSGLTSREALAGHAVLSQHRRT